MSSEHVERRLAAILAADVVGSCRLIGIDEEGTLAQLKALRKTLFDPKIAQHHGRIVKNTGDGALVEFASVVDAVRCADDIQRGVAEQNTDVPQDKRIEFRIGIHLGDIIIADDDIFGDGVNIAVRLEGIAEPGGICISDDAHRQVRGKVESTLEDMGAQTLKNIAEPMRAWRVRIGPSSSPATKTPTETAQPLALPDKPSIAVLPFQNMVRRSRAGILCRRYRRRHHHRAVALQVAVRDRAQFELHLQGPSGRYQGSRAKARRALCPRGVCAEGVGESSHHRAVDRCGYRRASMGGQV